MACQQLGYSVGEGESCHCSCLNNDHGTEFVVGIIILRFACICYMHSCIFACTPYYFHPCGLNFSDALALFSGVNEISIILLNDVNCSGGENSLLECVLPPTPLYTEGSCDYFGVNCTGQGFFASVYLPLC